MPNVYPAAYKPAARAYGLPGLSNARPAIPANTNIPDIARRDAQRYLRALNDLVKTKIPANDATRLASYTRGVGRRFPLLGLGIAAGVELWSYVMSEGEFTGEYTTPAGWFRINTQCGGTPNVWRYYSEPPQGGGEAFGAFGPAPQQCAQESHKYDFNRPMAGSPVYANGMVILNQWVQVPGTSQGTFGQPDTWFTRLGARIGYVEGMPSEFPQPVMLPGSSPIYGPASPHLPSENPMEFPIGRPVEVYPQRWEDAVAEPGSQPSSRPSSRPGRPNPRPEVLPLPSFPPFRVFEYPPLVQPQGSPQPLPVAVPNTVISVNPRGEVTITTVPGQPPTNRPPGPNTFEAKVQKKYGAARAFVSVGVNMVTEGLDFIDALYKGIPEGAAFCAVHDYKCKFAALWKYRDQIDYAVVFQNFVNNNIEDMAFGILGQQTGKAQGNLGITTGVGRATSHGQGGEADISIEGEDTSSLTPELTYNRETGEWGFQWEAFGWSTGQVYVPGFYK